MKTVYTVQEEDIFVINSFEMNNFELEANALALSFSVSLRFLSAMNPEMLKYRINCRSFLHNRDTQELFDILRGDLARAFKEQYKNTNHRSKHFKSKTAAILEDLSRYFLDRKKRLKAGEAFNLLNRRSIISSCITGKTLR